MAGIDKNRWTLLSPLLDELLDADEAVRSVRLAHIRDTDGDLADDLSALLHRQSVIEKERFLEGSVAPLPVEPVLAGREIGNYTLERQLGRGGMGAVWLAHRSDGRYAGHAAVKFLNLSLLGPAGIDRFKSEGNALARLAHPNIARLIDAGVTAEGQPTWCSNMSRVSRSTAGARPALSAFAHACVCSCRSSTPSRMRMAS